MENWEINLRDGSSEFGMTDIASWNKKLSTWVKEWKSVVESFEKVAMQQKSKYLENSGHEVYAFEIKMRNTDLSFHMSQQFSLKNGIFQLQIETIESYDKKEYDFIPIISTEEISQIEIREKEFVLSLLNQKWFNYLKWLKNNDFGTWENIMC